VRFIRKTAAAAATSATTTQTFLSFFPPQKGKTHKKTNLKSTLI
jgi:hypothetical protein